MFDDAMRRGILAVDVCSPIEGSWLVDGVSRKGTFQLSTNALLTGLC